MELKRSLKKLRTKFSKFSKKLGLGKHDRKKSHPPIPLADSATRNEIPADETPAVVRPTSAVTIPEQEQEQHNPHISIEGSTSDVLSDQAGAQDVTSLASNKNPAPSPCLWEEALNQLSEEDSSSLNKILHPGSDDSTAITTRNLDQEILQIIEFTKQRQQDNNGWHFEFRGQTVYIRDLTKKVLDWVNKFKECVDVAVSFDPVHAALPWAAVRFLITAAITDTEQDGLLLVFLEVVTRLITRCRVYEELYVRPLNREQNGIQIEDVLRRLYVNILKYLCSAINLIQHTSTRRTIHAIINPGEISGFLVHLENLEREVNKELNLCENLYHRQGRQGFQELGGQYLKLRELLAETIAPRIEEMATNITDLQLENFCDWLRSTNPSARYNEMLKLHQHETSSWIFPMQEWQDWFNQAPDISRSLWVHGIPGSGKSVLAAHLINEISKECQKSSGNELCLFYFCYFANNQDETLPMLRWIASQLCQISKQVPTRINQMYKQRLEPTEEDLLSAIATLSSRWTRIFLVVDALDESLQPRLELLSVLCRLATEPHFNNIWTLTTSREYDDIKNTMLAFSISISMSNEGLDGDIKKFIWNNLRIKPDKKFAFWPESLIDEVEDYLIFKSRGMFQWVKCQIDYLGRLHNINKIREALESLPPTLYDTYDRIISLIPKEDMEFIRRVLHWISYAEMTGRSVPPGALFIASIPTIDMNKYTYRQEHIPDLCGCLLHEDEDHTIVFAHFTVREYLQSAHLSAPYKSLAITPSLAKDMTKDTFRRLLELNASTKLDRDKIRDYISLCDEHLSLMIEFRVQADMDSEMELLIARFTNPSLPHYDFYLEHKLKESWRSSYIMDKFFTYPSQESRLDSATTNAIMMGNCVSLGLFPLAEKLLVDKGFDILEKKVSLPHCLTRVSHPYQNGQNIMECILEYLPTYLHPSGVGRRLEFLLDKFDIFCRVVDKHKAISYYITRHREDHHNGNCQPECRLQRLLDMGASPDSNNLDLTPLQIAVINRDLSAVKILLDRGANPNGKGIAVYYAHLQLYCYDVGFSGTMAGMGTRELVGKSSLEICSILPKAKEIKDMTGLSEIIDLLIQYGGNKKEE